MFTVLFTQPARLEMIAAQDWYEREVPGLGARFRQGIDAVVTRMEANPLQFPVVHRNARRGLLRRFPYMLLFTIQGDRLVVIACFHCSRDPQRWQSRVPTAPADR